jgi:hypothetical protein
MQLAPNAMAEKLRAMAVCSYSQIFCISSSLKDLEPLRELAWTAPVVLRFSSVTTVGVAGDFRLRSRPF